MKNLAYLYVSGIEILRLHTACRRILAVIMDRHPPCYLLTEHQTRCFSLSLMGAGHIYAFDPQTRKVVTTLTPFEIIPWVLSISVGGMNAGSKQLFVPP